MPTYLTKKERELQAKQFQVMLRTCHRNLESLCNERLPTTLEGLTKRADGSFLSRNPAKTIALNKRINAQNERIEDLLLSIEYGEPCPDNSFLTAGDTATPATPADIKADIDEAFNS